MNTLHQLARDWLPDVIRKPLGSAIGWLHNNVIRWIQGALFDSSGAHFHADNCTFAIPKNQTSRDYRVCFLDGSYEAEERELVRTFVRPSDAVLELGACLGVVSCVTNKILADRTRHVVVEGNPFCLPTSRRNRELNECGFIIENCAVSNRPDAESYLHPTYIVGGATQRQSSRPVRVPVHSLSDLDDRYGPFSAFIIDVEGSELEVLSAASKQLKGSRLVIVELHEWAIGAEGAQRCREILNDAGLRFQKRAGSTEAWQRD